MTMYDPTYLDSLLAFNYKVISQTPSIDLAIVPEGLHLFLFLIFYTKQPCPYTVLIFILSLN